MRKAALACSLGVVTGCQATGDADVGPDAAAPGDDQHACEMIIQDLSPSDVERGETVVARAEITRIDPDLEGIERFSWVVTSAGDELETTPRDEYGEEIEFDALRSGIYDIELSGEVGADSCRTDVQAFNVSALGARREDYELRVVAPGESSPALFEVEILGGADYYLGTIGIDADRALSGSLSGPDGPLAAYLRIRGAGGAEVEGFADDAGEIRAPEPPGGEPYEITIVPDGGDVAPVRIGGISRADLSDVEIGAGEAIAGTVETAGGSGVAGAEVSLAVDGVPSTLAETDQDGGFTVRARPGTATIRITAPPESGLFDLEASGVDISAEDSLEITYADGPAAVPVEPDITEPDGVTAAPEAGIRWVAEDEESAAEVAAGGAAVAATGALEREVRADDAGASPPLTLPETRYDVLITGDGENGDAAAARQTIDLAADGAPDVLALAEPARLEGIVRGEGQQGGLRGTRVLALPRGPLARAQGGTSGAEVGEDGAFALPVAGGASYDLAFAPPVGTPFAKASAGATAPPPGEAEDLGTIELPAAITVRGEISALGSGRLAGAHVSLYCAECADPGPPSPVAEAITDSAGRFHLRVPDPGVREGE